MGHFASFWYGSQLSRYEWLCISSFIRAGHSFELFTYDHDIKVPEGCVLREAAEIYPQSKVFFYNDSPTPKVSAFANMFRYRLIHETGHCWVDTDVLCLSREIADGPFLFARQDSEHYNCAILRFPAGHEAMRLAAEYCWERRGVCGWGDLGPRLFTRVVEEYGLEREAVPIQALYPVHWRQSGALFSAHEAAWVRERIVGAQMLHLWNETFGSVGISKASSPPPGSFLAAAFEEAELQHGLVSGLARPRTLTRHYGINQTTVAKWRGSTSDVDIPTGPRSGDSSRPSPDRGPAANDESGLKHEIPDNSVA